MKNLFTLVVSFLAIQNIYSQCTISSTSNPSPNQSLTFEVDAKAQCEECYSWKSSDEQILKIDGTNKNKAVKLSSKNPGKANVSVSVLTDKGLLQCDKSVEIVSNTASKQNVFENSCGIPIDDFKDVKVNESIISFFPNVNSNDYQYKWTVKYSNGETGESAEKIPQFSLVANAYINAVKLKITNKVLLCSITLTKKFDENYWKAAKNVVEQKTYSPISYSEYIKQQHQAE